MELGDLPDEFDVVIVGTGIAESIAAGAISRSNKSVLHLDPNTFYGQHQSALSLPHFLLFATGMFSESLECSEAFLESYEDVRVRIHPYDGEGDTKLLSSSETYASLASKILGIKEEDIQDSRSDLSKAISLKLKCMSHLLEPKARYNIELSPKVFVNKGELVETLIRTGIGRFLTFKSLDGVYVGRRDQISRVSQYFFIKSDFKVPFQKAEVFRSDYTLIEKRMLMKTRELCDLKDINLEYDKPYVEFLESKKFNREFSQYLVSGLILSPYPEEIFKVSAKEGISKSKILVQSFGIWDKSAFLVGNYGGITEILQAFCRYSAVYGSTYILGAKNFALLENGIELSGRKIKAKKIILSACYAGIAQKTLKRKKIQRYIAILDASIFPPNNECQSSDAFILVLPPKCVGNENPLIGIQVSGKSFSCPEGKYILYLSSKSPNKCDQDFQFVVNNISKKLNIPTPKILMEAFFTQLLSEKDLEISPRIAYVESSDDAFGLNEKDIPNAKKLTAWANNLDSIDEFIPSDDRRE